MSELIPAPTDDLELEKFISQGNAHERGDTVPEASGSDAPEKALLGTEPPKTSDAADPAIAAAEDTPEKPKKPRNDPAARIAEATAKQAEAKRERDEAKAEIARLAAELAAAKAAKPAPAAEPKEPLTNEEYKRYRAMPDAPKLGKFEDYEDYNAAMSLFIASKLVDERLDAREAKRGEQTRLSAYQERLAAARTADATFQAAIDAAGDLRISLPMRDRVLDSPVGPILLRYFAEHATDTQRIFALHPDSALVELGKLEERLTPRPDAARPTGPAPSPVISQARAPIQPVRATPTASDDDGDDDSISVEEHIRRENAKDRDRLRTASR